MSDRVLLHGLVFYGYHGAREEENRLGQRFIVDIELVTDTRAAAAGDDLTKAVNYVDVYEETKAIVEGPACKLIETVAERIAEAALRHRGAQSVRVRVRKPDVPIPAMLEYVGVEVVRPGSV
jgi:dihydroneopterin aldolase